MAAPLCVMCRYHVLSEGAAPRYFALREPEVLCVCLRQAPGRKGRDRWEAPALSGYGLLPLCESCPTQVSLKCLTQVSPMHQVPPTVAGPPHPFTRCPHTYPSKSPLHPAHYTSPSVTPPLSHLPPPQDTFHGPPACVAPLHTTKSSTVSHAINTAPTHTLLASAHASYTAASLQVGTFFNTVPHSQTYPVTHHVASPCHTAAGVHMEHTSVSVRHPQPEIHSANHQSWKRHPCLLSAQHQYHEQRHRKSISINTSPTHPVFCMHTDLTHILSGTPRVSVSDTGWLC